MHRRAFFRSFWSVPAVAAVSAQEPTERPLMPVHVVCPRCSFYVPFPPEERTAPPLAVLTFRCSCGWTGQSPRLIPVPED